MDYSLRTDIAQDLLCPAESWQRAKSEYVEAQSGLLPSEGKVGSEDMLLARLLECCHYPLPASPLPLAVRAGPRLFCSSRRSTGSWRVGKAEKTCLSQTDTPLLPACLLDRWPLSRLLSKKADLPSLLKQGPLCAPRKRA